MTIAIAALATIRIQGAVFCSRNPDGFRPNSTETKYRIALPVHGDKEISDHVCSVGDGDGDGKFDRVEDRLTAFFTFPFQFLKAFKDAEELQGTNVVSGMNCSCGMFAITFLITIPIPIPITGLPFRLVLQLTRSLRSILY